MTDLEISKALALAIGYRPMDVMLGQTTIEVWAAYRSAVHGMRWRPFDYRDWSVIGPIAGRYDCFPEKNIWGNWLSSYMHIAGSVEADTPQKAIAMAVIQGAKK